ncbi:MAG: TIM barrel protein [Deltaproteobacteria bacterium]|jgi:hydroxypyruvate isomerase|nr:TIM barrel protein [Deltaproteobacteria bacterium]
MPRFAANLTMMFADRPMTERFAAAKAAGFAAVEMLFPYDMEPETVADLLRRNSLHLVLFNICQGDFAGGERGLACLPGRTEDFRAALLHGEHYVEVLRPDCVHVMAGLLPANVSREEAERVYVDNVRLAARTLARHHTAICLEAISGVSMPGFFLSCQEQTARCLDLIDESNVGMQFDCFHCQMAEGNVAGKLRAYLPRIRHIQIAGAPERHEPDTGELRYEYLFSLLDEFGYPGYVGCEYNPAGRTEDGLDWYARWK